MNVFISYETTTGYDLATNVKKALAKIGIGAFLARSDVLIGEADRRVIDKAIGDCNYFVVVITLLATSSGEVKREIQLAHQLNKHIIPTFNMDDRALLNSLPVVRNLQQIHFDSKENLADQVVTEIIKLKARRGIWANWRSISEEAAETELKSTQSAVLALMVDNALSQIPNPVTIATRDMGAFPDSVSTCGVDKVIDPKGNSYQPGDKNGFILFQHDIIADNGQTRLVNYVTERYTKGTYTVDSMGTITQVTIGY